MNNDSALSTLWWQGQEIDVLWGKILKFNDDQYQNNDAWDKAVSWSPIWEIKYDVTWCINWLTNSRLNTIFWLSGRTWICWESAINCYLWADY